MSIVKFKSTILGISSCYPSTILYNKETGVSNTKDVDRLIENTGVYSRRITDVFTTAADLCEQAAKSLILEMDTDKNDIGVIVFVTQYPDYIAPSTVHQLKVKLELVEDCIAIQINEGCAGYLYGIMTANSLLQSQNKNYAIILAGDTISKVIDPQDSQTAPLFGDGGTATIIKKSTSSIHVSLGSNGNGWQDISIKYGSFREGFTSKPILNMNGINVFMFGISKVPLFMQTFLNDLHLSAANFDYLVLHQANKMMNDKIAKKMQFSVEQNLSSLKDFGNTGVASIPLTIATCLKSTQNQDRRMLLCGFGTGLAWGVADITLPSNVTLLSVQFDRKP